MSHRIEFRPPDGAVPEGLTAGEEFDSVCTFRVKDSGEICLVMLGDAQMPGYGEKYKSQSKPAYQAPDELPERNNSSTY